MGVLYRSQTMQNTTLLEACLCFSSFKVFEMNQKVFLLALEVLNIVDPE